MNRNPYESGHERNMRRITIGLVAGMGIGLGALSIRELLRYSSESKPVNASDLGLPENDGRWVRPSTDRLLTPPARFLQPTAEATRPSETPLFVRDYVLLDRSGQPIIDLGHGTRMLTNDEWIGKPWNPFEVRDRLNKTRGVTMLINTRDGVIRTPRVAPLSYVPEITKNDIFHPKWFTALSYHAATDGGAVTMYAHSGSRKKEQRVLFSGLLERAVRTKDGYNRRTLYEMLEYIEGTLLGSDVYILQEKLPNDLQYTLPESFHIDQFSGNIVIARIVAAALVPNGSVLSYNNNAHGPISWFTTERTPVWRVGFDGYNAQEYAKKHITLLTCLGSSIDQEEHWDNETSILYNRLVLNLEVIDSFRPPTFDPTQ